MSTIVGTNIEVTNIKYDSDTTSMIISNAGQVTIQGEGTATTNLQQGLAKGWLKYDQVNTTIDDSHTVSSVTDYTTGRFDQNHSNNMANANYSTNVTSGYYRVYGTNREDGGGAGTPDTTGTAYYNTRYLSSGTTFTNIDMASNTTVIHGDLA
tara:strand:+ start:1070 stop:1528 length:459 start_codon:yes stop_codon:yes gene_type:complete